MPLTFTSRTAPGPIGLAGNWVCRLDLTSAGSTKIHRVDRTGYRYPTSPAFQRQISLLRRVGNSAPRPRFAATFGQLRSPLSDVESTDCLQIAGKWEISGVRTGNRTVGHARRECREKRRTVLRSQRSPTTDRAAKWRGTAPLSRECSAGKKVSQTGWRSGRDSNPRYAFGVYSLSRRAPSTTRPPLRIPGSPPA